MILRSATPGDNDGTTFGAMLASFMPDDDDQAFGRLPSPNEHAATAFNALGLLEGATVLNHDNPEARSPSVTLIETANDARSASPTPENTVTSLPPIVPIPVALNGTDADDPALGAMSAISGAPVGSGLIEPPAVERPGRSIARASATVEQDLPKVAEDGGETVAPDVETPASDDPSRPPGMMASTRQAAATLAVIIGEAADPSVRTSVAAHGSGLDDLASEGLADKVRTLLARHGLVLGTLRVNGRAAAGDFANDGGR